MSKIKEAIREYWGERCPDFDPTCPTCQAWAEFDALRTPETPASDRVLVAEAAGKIRDAAGDADASAVVEALTKARDTFRDYERMHRAKIQWPLRGEEYEAVMAKVERNRLLAEEMDAALAKLDAAPDNVIGRKVQKRGGDYEFDGEIRAVIVKRSGAVRYAVEDDRGLLLVMNAKQVGLDAAPDASGAGERARIRPLHWYKPTDHPQDGEDALWMAHGIGGRYSIQEDAGKFIVWDEFSFVTCDTIEACKAWAEADWQKNVRAALRSSPPADGEMDRIDATLTEHGDGQQ